VLPFTSNNQQKAAFLATCGCEALASSSLPALFHTHTDPTPAPQTQSRPPSRGRAFGSSGQTEAFPRFAPKARVFLPWLPGAAPRGSSLIPAGGRAGTGAGFLNLRRVPCDCKSKAAFFLAFRTVFGVSFRKKNCIWSGFSPALFVRELSPRVVQPSPRDCRLLVVFGG
jgi:hypothetical protein